MKSPTIDEKPNPIPRDPDELRRLDARMRVYARRRLPADRVDDCVQDVWLASMKPGAFAGRCRFDTFLMAVLRRRIADVYRARARGPAALDHDPPAVPVRLEERVDARRALLRLQPSFARLPDRQRATLEVELLPCEDGHERLDAVAPVNRRVLLHRARTSLRRAIEERPGFTPTVVPVRTNVQRGRSDPRRASAKRLAAAVNTRPPSRLQVPLVGTR
jgi:RNA polymerase sigma factor (sigma-70 family)